MDLDGLKHIKIHQFKQSNGKDSVFTITEVDSIAKVGDTLLVKPWTVDEVHYLDPNADITITKIAKYKAKEMVKIPINEIDKLVGKKGTLSRALTFISTAAFIGVATSIPLRLGNSDNQAVGNTIFVIAAPALIVSWTLQVTVAKRRYHFDKSRTDKKVWSFN